MQLNSKVGRYSLVVKFNEPQSRGEVWIFQSEHGDCVEWSASAGEPTDGDLDMVRVGL